MALPHQRLYGVPRKWGRHTSVPVPGALFEKVACWIQGDVYSGNGGTLSDGTDFSLSPGLQNQVSCMVIGFLLKRDLSAPLTRRCRPRWPRRILRRMFTRCALPAEANTLPGAHGQEGVGNGQRGVLPVSVGNLVYLYFFAFRNLNMNSVCFFGRFGICIRHVFNVYCTSVRVS